MTDGRTDGQTEFSSLDRVCILCSEVKTLGWFLWYEAEFRLALNHRHLDLAALKTSEKSLSENITVVLQCYRRQAVPMEQRKIRPSVTFTAHFCVIPAYSCPGMTTAEIVYSEGRSLSNLVWVITSATATHFTPILVEFGWVEIIPRLFVVSFFSCTRLEKKSVNRGARTSEISQGCAFFGDFDKNCTPYYSSKIPKVCITKAVFRSTHA